MPEPLAQEPRIREAVGAFRDVPSLEKTFDDLLTAGFAHSDISLLASDDTVKRKLGRFYVDVREAADDPQAPRRDFPSVQARTEGKGALTSMLGYIGALTAGGVTIATGGAAGAVIAAGVLGGGALAALGAALGRAVDSQFTDDLQRQVERGGIILWVKVADADQERRAQEVLRRHGAEGVHVHSLRATNS
ncbi:MAG: hypothetical protein H3C38_17670 [Rhodospirillales bacterium]|nr:hypothetical protein [Rhodospirillales bacterium]